MPNSLFNDLNKNAKMPTQMPQMNRGQMLMEILRNPKGFYDKALSNGWISQDWVNQNMSKAKQLQSQLMRMRK